MDDDIRDKFEDINHQIAEICRTLRIENNRRCVELESNVRSIREEVNAMKSRSVALFRGLREVFGSFYEKEMQRRGVTFEDVGNWAAGMLGVRAPGVDVAEAPPAKGRKSRKKQASKKRVPKRGGAK